ncbi:MAG: hypothetical protein RLO80_11920 [Hyphomonas sp.]
MTRRQRAVHAIVWPVLAVVLGWVIFASVSERARAAEAVAVDPEAV